MREPEAEIIVGGQAVLEGVMMRSPNAYAVSVRRADGTIASRGGRVPRLADAYPLLARPVLRGGATLVQSMVLGVKALNFSSAVALEDEEEREEVEEVEVRGGAAADGPDAAVPVSVPNERKSSAPGASATTAGPLVFALAANVALFIFLPLALTNAIYLAAGGGLDVGGPWSATAASLFASVRPTVDFNLVEGLVRIAIFLALVYSMSKLEEMHRVFQYHGAEHKVVAAFEAGGPLTVEAARPQPRRHPRCGTSFLMVVMMVAVALFSVVRFDSLAANAAARVALLPLVAGLSFEVIRAAARSQSGPLFRLMVLPGLWLQGITTQEPTDDQLEVAIHALEASLALESDE